jgi:uncharacterized protein (DUF58 family)
MERTLSWTDAVDVYIHPPWVRLGADAPGTIRDLEGQTTRALSDRDISFHALRDYVPGDDVRNIHWLASARLPNLVVRQYEDTRRVHSVLVLATDAAEYPEEADFELAVSVFASLGRQQLEERRTVTPFAGQTLLRRESPDAFLDACCELAPAPGGAPAALAARAAVDSTPGATLAAIVTGPGASIDDIRKIPRLLPRDLRCLTVRCGGGLPFAGLRSGDASHGDLTDLADLPELFRLVAGP